jgi:hypothetical protein
MKRWDLDLDLDLRKCRVLFLEPPIDLKDGSFSFELAQVNAHHLTLPRREAKRLRVRLALILGPNFRRSQL